METRDVGLRQAGIRRFVTAGNPDLQNISDITHGFTLQADRKLCMEDRLSYLEILSVDDFDVARFERVLASYRL